MQPEVFRTDKFKRRVPVLIKDRGMNIRKAKFAPIAMLVCALVPVEPEFFSVFANWARLNVR